MLGIDSWLFASCGFALKVTDKRNLHKEIYSMLHGKEMSESVFVKTK
jgi:hypothetical protein